MSAKKVHKYLLLLFVGGLVLSGWIVHYANTQLALTSSALTSLRTDIANLEHKREGLQKAKVILNDNSHTLDTLSKVIPEDKDQARIVEEIYSIASKAGVNIESVGFPASTLGSPAVKAVTPTVDNSTSAPKTTTPPKNVSQATPLKDIPGVQAIDLSIGAINSKTLPAGSGVRYSEMMSFIRQIERNQRAIQITALGIGQGPVVNGEQTFTLTISLTIFIRS